MAVRSAPASRWTRSIRKLRGGFTIAASIVLAGLSIIACDGPVLPEVLEDPPTISPSEAALGAFEDITPRFSPDGDTLVFVRTQDKNADIVVMEIASGVVRHLVDLSGSDLDPAYSPDGRLLVFESTPNRYAQLHLVSVDGAGARSISEVLDGWATFPAWSPRGDRVVYSCGHPIYEESDLCILTTSGVYLGRLEPPSTSQELQPAWSPDGSTIAFSSNRSGGRDLYLLGLASGRVTTLTHGATDDGDPAWSPDGTIIAFTRAGAGSPRICVVGSEGGSVECVTEGIQPSWSPDGQMLVFYRPTADGTRIFLANADGTHVEQVT